MKTPKLTGLSTPPQTAPNQMGSIPMAAAVRATITDLHKMAMGVAMQNLLKRIKSNPKSL